MDDVIDLSADFNGSTNNFASDFSDSGLELLMNDRGKSPKIKDTDYDVDIQLEDLTNLENELNDLSGLDSGMDPGLSASQNRTYFAMRLLNQACHFLNPHLVSRPQKLTRLTQKYGIITRNSITYRLILIKT